jgi:type IV pilus assembly protein PilM
MAILDSLQRLLEDPPPEFAFELSEAGIAYLRPGAVNPAFEPLEPGAIEVSPLRDNVMKPESLRAKVLAIAGASAKRRRTAALILPDYCARVAVLEFDSFPKVPQEQQSLVRFRMKRTVPFDIDGAAVSFFPQPSGEGKGFEVIVVAAALEIVARYEAPFRAAGFHPGLVTTSALAGAELSRGAGVHLVAKLSGHVLTVTVLKNGVVKLVRCLEVPDANHEDVTGVLFSTVAFVEDEEGARPERLSLAGFQEIHQPSLAEWENELGLKVERIKSSITTPEHYNVGLLGYIESQRGIVKGAVA